ncbi:hypothetical protein TSYNT_1116 [Tepidanaerobacter syntrophicus]|uniref:Uncharacterized protein n=1 Tax=Tepidanaerobacter syntrophicus TaxID=224999 RepID=A0A0U9HIM9_9FIRM|nr:hypothetical protein TSYNT_1116 [Tepidanaerobacter syntrophicus]
MLALFFAYSILLLVLWLMRLDFEIREWTKSEEFENRIKYIVYRVE